MELFNRVLGGQFMSRLNLNLREDKHWSYGAHTEFASRLGVRAFIASAAVQTDKTKESILEMRRELKEILLERPVTAQELSTVTDERARQLTADWSGNRRYLAAVLAPIALYSLPDDHWETYMRSLQQVGLADVQAAAHTLLADEPITWVVAGDLSKIEAGLRELDIGTVKIFDATGNVLR